VNALTEEDRTHLLEETTLKAERLQKTAARKTLKACLLKASRISKASHSDTRLPRVRSDQNLIEAGRRLALEAQAMEADFVGHGLPPKFADIVRTATLDLETAVRTSDSAKVRLRASAERWNTTLDATLETLRHFDVLVANVFEDDPGELAAYAALRAIPRGRTRKSAEAPAAGDSPPAASNASSAA
jgi:hypothetical protein